LQNTLSNPATEAIIKERLATPKSIASQIKKSIPKNQYLTAFDYSGKGRSGITFGDFKKYRGIIKRVLDDAGAKKIKNKEYVDAIARRHEADEVRYGTKVNQNKKLKFNMNGTPVSSTAYASHLTPRVLVDESRHTALAPKDVKDFYKKMRGMTGEKADLLSKNKSFKYGEKAVLKGRLGRKMEKSVSNQFKNIMKAMM
jgi:hypothetical protein